MSNATYKGSCLCGEVQYELRGEAITFYHCHCRRCRKASGTGHASNIRVNADSINWLRGEGQISIYKVPESERFSVCFCTKCGSPLPRYVPQLDAVVIPAGSLDGEPPIKPQARIFWDSRAEWSCSGDELPTFSEYPK